MTDRLVLTRELTEALCARVDESPLPDADRTILKACVRYCFALGEAYTEKSHTIKKLLRMIFGAKTEKAATVIADFPKKPKKEKSPCRGHGRNGAASYTGGKKVTVSHSALKGGDCCPECQRGRLYRPSGGDDKDHRGCPAYRDVMGVREAPVQRVRGSLHREAARYRRGRKVRCRRRRHDHPAQVRDGSSLP